MSLDAIRRARAGARSSLLFVLAAAFAAPACGSEQADSPDESGQPDAGAPTPDGGLDDDGDQDADGLTNAVERELGTDPERSDTDGDALSDAEEVGDAAQPRDGDGDGFIDALESELLDNDRDGTADQSDVAAAGAWQVVFARCDPAVIANDGVDATRIEVHVAGARPTRLTLGMDTAFWFPVIAPDEVEVDGEKLGTGRIELLDDGSHGDRVAGDGVYARGGITTRMKPRQLYPDTPATSRGEVMLGSVEATLEGAPETRQLGFADEGPTVFPGGFWLRFIEADQVRAPTSIDAHAQRTDHLLNVVEAQTALAVQRKLSGPSVSEFIGDRVELMRPALALLEKDVDFLYVYPAQAAYGTRAGIHTSVSSEAGGLGLDVFEAAPEWRAGRLKSIVVLDYQPESPLLHETMHHWGVALDPSFGFDTASAHWGNAGTYGVLGGFDPSTLVDHGDGTLSVGFFANAGNTWTTTPFSPIELYLMGLVGPEAVTPIPVLENPELVAYEEAGVLVRAGLHSVSIDDIVGKHGSRTPDVGASQKDFEAAFAIFSERLLTPAELAFVDSRARGLEAEHSAEGITFQEATGGRGTMRTALAPPASE